MMREGHWFPKLQHKCPLYLEKVAGHNTDINLLLSTSVRLFLISPPIERREIRPIA